MRTLRAAGLAGAAVLLATATAARAGPTPPPPPGPRLTDAAVATAVARLDATITDGMRRTGVPGLSVAVVHDDEVVYLKGFGLRRTGESAKVGPDTVFQLASVSKPVTSTVIAGALASPDAWDRPLAGTLPGFGLKDPWVTSHVTPADLISHRSGLPDHAGDLLEDLGYDRAYILGHLREEPLTPFRASYAYTNFGFTAAAEAVARDHGVSWQKLSEDTLFKPAGMTRTSTEFAAYAKAPDRASGHVKNPDGSWSPRYVRDADAQSPAGGASSTARDMSRWLRLQLDTGTLDGKRIFPADALTRTWLPEIVSQAQTPRGTPQFYGLGWNVSYDDAGRLRLSHSGGFELGANTNVTLLPLERLGIVVLTNGSPVGLADSVALDFFDIAEHGKPTADWLPLLAATYERLDASLRSPTDYARPPAGAAPARADSAYTGTYDNPYYGPLTVTADAQGGLTLSLGPKPLRFPLTHYDGDTFSFETTGENAVGRTGVFFSDGKDGKDGKVRIEYLDQNHLGTFTRR
ncbi:serine hydrolase [Streptomyces lavendulae]|uniref:serine hydrolase n=1 Tax=Streptomyces lavendulae TaxID=1914 RepID=UPI0024A151B7|nr:serine hydrolase [Streptomyces lavendulae]GLX19276.1 serine hydrolase [Streptomyces lavendulae subsp. lavendulae]GLX25995.1 serine hydrolase [Streptomyces lavendulae subsp. lavendulae]